MSRALVQGKTYWLPGVGVVEFSRIGGTGLAIVHPPGEPDMQSSTACDPAELQEVNSSSAATQSLIGKIEGVTAADFEAQMGGPTNPRAGWLLRSAPGGCPVVDELLYRIKQMEPDATLRVVYAFTAKEENKIETWRREHDCEERKRVEAVQRGERCGSDVFGGFIANSFKVEFEDTSVGQYVQIRCCCGAVLEDVSDWSP